MFQELLREFKQYMIINYLLLAIYLHMAHIRTTLMQTCNQNNSFCSMFNAVSAIRGWFFRDDSSLFGDEFKNINSSRRQSVSEQKRRMKLIKQKSLNNQNKTNEMSLKKMLDQDIYDFNEKSGYCHILQLQKDQNQNQQANDKDEIETVVSITPDNEQFFSMSSTLNSHTDTYQQLQQFEQSF